MGLSIDSIYRPFNDFFTKKFNVGTGVPMQFRFSRLPQAFIDSDFLSPLHPEEGPLQIIANELLSVAVDGVLLLNEDGKTVWFSSSRISELYRDEILGPAQFFTPADVTNSEEIQNYIDAFVQVKNDAIKLLNTGAKVSSVVDSTPGSTLYLSTATPIKWWDRTDNDVWVNHTIEVKDAITQPSTDSTKLWRRKIDETVFRSIVREHYKPIPSVMLTQPTLVREEVVARPAVVRSHVLSHSIREAMLSQPTAEAVTVGRAGLLRSDAPLFVNREATMLNLNRLHVEDRVAFEPRFKDLSFKERLAVVEESAVKAPPNNPVMTNEVTISFDYCTVNVRRAWLHEAFINNLFWRIPGQGKGKLSANDGHGLPSLPVGFIAVKNLRIKAPWTPEDISNIGNSVQFGPFNFDSKVVDGVISHDGIQIIGWMLQDLPLMPPN